MFADTDFIELSRKFVCVRLETYESEANQKLVREVLHGKLANTAFVVLAPDGETRLSRASRSPSMTFGKRGWRQGEGALKETMAGLERIAKKYPAQGSVKEALVPDFYSFTQALNVSSADQRPLVLTVAPERRREALRESLQVVANDPSLRGKFHYDTAESGDAKWAQVVEGVNEKTGHFILWPGQFGLQGKSMVRVPLDVKPDRLKQVMLRANEIYQAKERAKNYREHFEKGQELGISYESVMPHAVDKDGDGILDRGRQGGRRMR